MPTRKEKLDVQGNTQDDKETPREVQGNTPNVPGNSAETDVAALAVLVKEVLSNPETLKELGLQRVSEQPVSLEDAKAGQLDPGDLLKEPRRYECALKTYTLGLPEALRPYNGGKSNLRWVKGSVVHVKSGRVAEFVEKHPKFRENVITRARLEHEIAAEKNELRYRNSLEFLRNNLGLVKALKDHPIEDLQKVANDIGISCLDAADNEIPKEVLYEKIVQKVNPE